MFLFLLSQKNLPLAQAEIASFYPISKTKDHYAFVSSKKKIDTPLAFTKTIHDILFSCSKKDLEKKIQTYNWNKKIQGSFCVRSVAHERELASAIWKNLKKPCVDLEHPDTFIHFFFLGKKVFAAKQIWKNTNTFLQRKATQRPGFYPASLDPQLALAMVNLSGAGRGMAIVDPFCGTGGILIEAAFSGRKAIGYDISEWMLEKCKKNIEHYNLKNVIFSVGDATRFQKKCHAIVTELPFGKNTKSQDLILLYFQFLENARRNTKRMVVSFPDFVDFRKLIKKSKWKIKESFLWYVHKSMSKEIVVLTH
ncbi:MAG: methyltransferase domain-containing protein [Nanoarchaeota archaeon]